MTDSFKGFYVVSFLSVVVLPLAISAAPLGPISAAEKDAHQREDAPGSTPSTALTPQNPAELATDLAVSQAAAAFLAQADLPAIPPASVPAATQPLDVKSGPDTARIQSDGGSYLDLEQGILVYLGNVTIDHPDYKLSGANELKIYFEKNSPKSDKKPAPKRIVATGAVLIEQTRAEAGKEPIKASGAKLSYDLEADLIVITGGFPWVLQGTTYMRAKEANAVLEIRRKARSFRTDKSRWEMGLDLPKN